MPIISSESIVDTHSQPSGARYVIEKHTDELGRVYQVGPYLAPVGFDIASRLAERAVELNNQLIQEEVKEVINGS